MADTLGTTAEQGGDLLTQVITGDATIADILARAWCGGDPRA